MYKSSINWAAPCQCRVGESGLFNMQPGYLDHVLCPGGDSEGGELSRGGSSMEVLMAQVDWK